MYMASDLKIESVENKLFKLFTKLKIKKHRYQYGLFLAEGEKFLQYKENIEYYIFSENKYNENKYNLGSKVVILKENLFNKISNQTNSQGIIIVYKILKYDIKNIGSKIFVLDEIQDPGNLGTILRTLDAAGFKDLILTTKSVDVYNDKVIRSTMGSIFNLNIYYFTKDEIVNFAKENDYTINSFTLSKNSLDYRQLNVKEKNLYVFGNEGHGVSDIFLKNSIKKFKIPMKGSVESLNIATSLALVAYKIQEIQKII